MGHVPAEFILLSNTQRLYFREAAPGFDISTYTGQYVRWCNVMWIVWQPRGVAEYLAVGQIHEDRWKEAEPVPKKIVLG